MIKIVCDNSLNIFCRTVDEYKNKNIIIVTYPPFNINYKYNKYCDNMDEMDYFNMLSLFFKNFPSVVIHYPEQLYKLSLSLRKTPQK